MKRSVRRGVQSTSWEPAGFVSVDKGRNKVRGVDLALINEALRAIIDGHATINGKAPGNRKERFIVIASYFKTAKTSFNMLFDGPIDVKSDYTVAIKYKDEPFTYKFPETETLQ